MVKHRNQSLWIQKWILLDFLLHFFGRTFIALGNTKRKQYKQNYIISLLIISVQGKNQKEIYQIAANIDEILRQYFFFSYCYCFPEFFLMCEDTFKKQSGETSRKDYFYKTSGQKNDFWDCGVACVRERGVLRLAGGQVGTGFEWTETCLLSPCMGAAHPLDSELF